MAQDTWLYQLAGDFDHLNDRLKKTIVLEDRMKQWEETVERFLDSDPMQERHEFRADMEHVWGIYHALESRVERMEETSPADQLDEFKLRLEDCVSQIRNHRSSLAKVDNIHTVLETRVHKLEGNPGVTAVSAAEHSRLSEQNDAVDADVEANHVSESVLGKKRARDDDSLQTKADDSPPRKVQITKGLGSNVKQYVERGVDGSVKLITQSFSAR
jgi:hypothetical protein